MEGSIRTTAELPGQLGIYGISPAVERSVDPRLEIVTRVKQPYFAKRPAPSPAPGNGKNEYPR